MEEKNRYQLLIDAVESERKNEEAYFIQFAAEKTLQNKIEAGLVWYPCIINSKHFTIGEFLEIELERKGHFGVHRFKSGVGVIIYQLENPTNTIKGVVSFYKKEKIRVSIASSNPKDEFHAGKYVLEVVYDERPYRIMKQAIQTVLDSKEAHIVSLRTGIDKGDYFEGLERTVSENYANQALNQFQNNCINEIAKGPQLSIIHGPPGTGKTTTIIDLVKLLLKQKKRILICTASNNAIDLIAKLLDKEGVKLIRVGNVSRMGDNIAHLCLQEKMRNHDDWQHIKAVRIEAQNAKKGAKKFKRNFGPKERANRTQMYHEYKELNQWARRLESQLLEKIKADCDVFCSTLIGVSNSTFVDIQFDTLIIDEASQASEPECWNAILKAKKVILVGDHKQLPPTVKSKEALQFGLGETLLSRMTNTIKHSYMLKIQYRMNDAILRFPNFLSYNDRLQSSECCKNICIPEEAQIQFIDTAGAGFEEQSNNENKSRNNKGEVFIICEHLIQKQAIYKDYSIGIISPYSAQVKLIKETLSEHHKFRSLDIEVDSIDGFQGQEKEIIIISFVRSNAVNQLGFLKDIRRLNVALTRAKKKIILVGDSATLSNDSTYLSLIEHYEQNGLYQSAWEYMS